MKYIYMLLIASMLAACSSNEREDRKNEAGINYTKQSMVTQIVGIGIIEPEINIIQLSSPVNGIVKTVFKKEDDTVSIGTPILELDHQLEDAKVIQVTHEVSTQFEQIKADEAAVNEYEAKYKNVFAELQRLERLLAKGAETQQTVDDANTNLRSLQSNMDRLKAGVGVTKEKWEQSRAALQVAKIERDQKIIKSPVAGKILEVSALIGGATDTKQSIAQIRPVGKTIAECEIDELYADKVTISQKAWIRNVGATDTLATGKVYAAYLFLKKKSLFTDQAGEKEDRRVRTIKIILDEPEKLLLNARVECVIDISQNIKK